MNDWRYRFSRPGVAHLWIETAGRLWRSRCGRQMAADARELRALGVPGVRPKCRKCIPYEVSRA